MTLSALAFGAIVGLSLGLTGGGGAIFAVPLLVYGLGVEPRQAVGVSLAAVGTTAAIGFLGRRRIGQAELPTGLLFAGAGMVGAPIGSWISGMIPETWLLSSFALLMLVVAARMWRAAGMRSAGATRLAAADDDGPTCRRDAAGTLRLTSPCAALLTTVGVLSGVLSGLYGVGGGFVIVPALVMFSGMAIHRAVGTSLLVIALVSGAGVVSHCWAGRAIPLETTALFVLGGLGGMRAGSALGRRISGPALQRGFAGAIVAVALFVAVRTTMPF
ncbi:MAG: sulfite exporter TauE/SafE family protein [Pirellulales bacterium]|nr:sulfite exporter TauE/SafE family protein [Pirellulales bacterium]